MFQGPRNSVGHPSTLAVLQSSDVEAFHVYKVRAWPKTNNLIRNEETLTFHERSKPRSSKGDGGDVHSSSFEARCATWP